MRSSLTKSRPVHTRKPIRCAFTCIEGLEIVVTKDCEIVAQREKHIMKDLLFAESQQQDRKPDDVCQDEKPFQILGALGGATDASSDIGVTGKRIVFEHGHDGQEKRRKLFVCLDCRGRGKLSRCVNVVPVGIFETRQPVEGVMPLGDHTRL